MTPYEMALPPSYIHWKLIVLKHITFYSKHLYIIIINPMMDILILDILKICGILKFCLYQTQSQQIIKFINIPYYIATKEHYSQPPSYIDTF